MRIVITGASGNVGTALIPRLMAAGDHDVVALARRIPAYAALDGPQWVTADLSNDDCIPLLRRVMMGRMRSSTWPGDSSRRTR